MKHLLQILLFLPLIPALAAEPQVRLELAPQDGIFRMYPLAADGSPKTVRIELRASSKSPDGRDLLIRFTAQDIFRKPLEWRQELRLKLPADGATVTNTVEFQAGQGFFQVFATCQADGQPYEASTGLGIIPPYHRGVRPDSFFASNTSSIRTGLQLRFLQALGMKIQRTHLNPVVAEIPDQPQGACRLDLAALDRAWQDCLEHDTWILPIVGYHFGERMRSELARRTDKVAVVWNHTGPDANHLDRNGTLTLAQPGDIRAFDLVGREIPQHDGKLTVPFGEKVVWFTSAQLDVVTFRERLASARLESLTPANVSALSLQQPADQAQKLGVRLENQLNRDVRGTLTLTRQADGVERTVPVTLPAGRLQEIQVEWPAGNLSTQPRHSVTLTLKTDAGDVTRQQEIAVARFLKRSITVDGKLEDWADALPVLMDSAQSEGKLDPTLALLNPGRVKTESGDGGRVVLRVYTAYDKDNVYVAAAVREKQLLSRAGQPVTRRGRSETVELPYRMGEPTGLEHIRFCGDAFLFAFGFRDRVPGWGRQMDDPWAWKGHFYDTDDHYAVHTSSTGPQLVRQWGADTSRRIAYQTAAVPGVGPVPGAQVRIERDEAAQLTVYEMSIPRAELKRFNPEAGRLRFGFNLVSNEVGWPLQWASAAGVFDYWIGSGSFSPSWVSVLPCQTFFGIEH